MWLSRFVVVVAALLPLAIGQSYDEWKEHYDKSRRREKLDGFPVAPTRGQPIPMPQSMKTFPEERILTIIPTQLEMVPIGSKCDILSHAIDRYFKLIVQDKSADRRYPYDFTKNILCEDQPVIMNKIYIQVDDACDGVIYPNAESIESYSLEVTSLGTVLKATQVWGALRGLETFSQLVYRDPENHCLQMSQVQINDFPRFSYRGMLLDTGRHFYSKEVIFRNLDAMSYSKFNVFHWHIVDDEAFPYTSTSFPNLTLGAFLPSYVYTQADIAEVIEYARLRGIRVIPEFDTPGHSLTWGKAFKDLLTSCYTKEGKKNGKHGPIDPSKGSNFDILKTLLKEWRGVFPDNYIHLGGDEVEFGCWESNPNITRFMKLKNITTYSELESYYLQKLLNMASDLGMKYIVWQDPLNNGVKLDPVTVVQVWRGSGDSLKKYMKEVTSAGYHTIFSSPWYLNHISNPYGWGYMEDYYKADPQNFNGTKEEKNLVIGGEACMWGQYVDNTNLLANLWPLASIIAERLWSSEDQTNFDLISSRLSEMQCRMILRGIPATPITGPGYCDQNWTG